ncbi:MAG: UDP-N-acetylenolpyruvoylglucosamine reductase [Deltaproteobacteria bacterium GWC2_56_8]|nr:MAG: UDP-N-acetylenolpyruvoylglucosamine reductase [Deltaproteobacteria bacterium GWB2_55_19]OGP37463.1 MAG: UDP-N-acetylenolpyruvoylglucosamine reductase [Deltaproteobacteria bacterium GWC2_56_8]
MAVQYSLFFIQRFKGKVLFNVPMSEYTSIKIGGPADVMAFPQDEGDLKDILAFAEAKSFPFYILGGGTNLLVRDGGIRSIVINMSEGFKDIVWEDETNASVGAGVRLSELLFQCRERGLTGFEFASGIPGTIGGAVMMNAGAYGGEMKDIVEGVEVIGKKGVKNFIPKKDLAFAYRKAEVPKGAAVTRAHMKFEKSTPDAVKEKIRDLKERRKTTAHITFPNAGSVFRNPENKSAGRLIEEAGLKGERSGDAQISEVHANYIVNLGAAKAKDVLSLMALIRDRVYSQKGVVLEPEIKVIGEDQ